LPGTETNSGRFSLREQPHLGREKSTAVFLPG
jgi:hypothetical protein